MPVVGEGTTNTTVVKIPATRDIILAIRTAWFSPYTSRELEEMCVCYGARIGDDGNIFGYLKRQENYWEIHRTCTQVHLRLRYKTSM